MKYLVALILMGLSQAAYTSMESEALDLRANKDFVESMDLLTERLLIEGFEQAEILYDHWVKDFRSNCSTLSTADLISALNQDWNLKELLAGVGKPELFDRLEELLSASATEYYYCQESEFTSDRYSEGAYSYDSVISKGNRAIRFTLKTLYVD